MIKVILGSLDAIRVYEKNCISKISGRREKRSEIWASEVSIQCIQGTFDTQVVKIILGSLGAFPIFDNLVS